MKTIIAAFVIIVFLSFISYISHGQNVKSRAYDKSAYDRAVCIAENKCPWSHDGWKEHIRKYVGPYYWAGENLARNYNSWEEVYAAWELSPEHKKVLDKKGCYEGRAHYKNVYVLHKGC